LLTRTRIIILILTACYWLALNPGCAARGPVADVEVQPAPEGLARAKHVVLVLVDGLRPDSITAENAPFLRDRLEVCAYTLEAQTVRPSVTLPAHVSMVTGVPPNKHKVTWNSHAPRRGYVRVETVFDVVHRAGMSTALIGGKKKLLHLVRPDVVDYVSTSDRRSADVIEEALPFLASQRPQLTLLHLPDVDLAGHQKGWMSKRQLEVIRETDGMLRRLFETLESFEESWAVILTSDHGGHGRHHEGATAQDTTIPWIVCGSDVDPAELPPVSITATAGTALGILGLDMVLNSD
jgi:predicted AlkP superfamily pyrophosphatase or phosphodiesterase